MERGNLDIFHPGNIMFELEVPVHFFWGGGGGGGAPQSAQIEVGLLLKRSILSRYPWNFA